MSNINEQYESAALRFFEEHPAIRTKYYSQTLLAQVVAEMQQSLPTTVAAGLAVQRLIDNGTLQRTDNRSDEDDRQAAVAAYQQKLNRAVEVIDAQPLTSAEFELFASLSPADIAERYWAKSEFRVRYNKACREQGFRPPSAHPAAQEVPQEGELTLTVAEYNAMPAAEMKVRLRDPKFKMSVMKLIQRGEI